MNRFPVFSLALVLKIGLVLLLGNSAHKVAASDGRAVAPIEPLPSMASKRSLVGAKFFVSTPLAISNSGATHCSCIRHSEANSSGAWAREWIPKPRWELV
jgi:hypothetical protein